VSTFYSIPNCISRPFIVVLYFRMGPSQAARLHRNRFTEILVLDCTIAMRYFVMLGLREELRLHTGNEAELSCWVMPFGLLHMWQGLNRRNLV
jgi:hypothetical protein